ncbi:MAG: inosose dehydratase [Solirubrobacteraceae bacterium]|nr:inosose dehydratase [Solirubrobacteraceae bacterium]
MTPPGSPSPIRFGCQTYSWQMRGDAYKGRLDHMATVAAESGFQGIEPEVIMLGGYSDPGRAAEALDEAGLELTALAYAADWRAARETPAEREEADRFIAFLERFPATPLVVVQLPGADRQNLRERQKNAIACMDAVARRAAAAGVRATVHPNSPPGSAFRTAEDYERLLDGLDPELIGFTPDVGHLAAGGMDPLEVITRYRDRVDHVHFKDIDADGTWAPTGEGRIDFPGIVAHLRDTAYSGWIVFEDESPSVEQDPDLGARRNGVYARDVLAPLLDADGRR